MNLLYALESVRTPFWDAVFSAVTHLGEETVFMVAAILIFWCVSKQEGYYLLLMGFFGTVVNQFLKLLFRIPRPWVREFVAQHQSRYGRGLFCRELEYGSSLVLQHQKGDGSW